MSDVENAIARLDRVAQNLAETARELAVVADRQARTQADIDTMRRELDDQRRAHLELDRKVDKWVNRGWGAWGIVVLVFTIVTAFGVPKFNEAAPAVNPPVREHQEQRNSQPR